MATTEGLLIPQPQQTGLIVRLFKENERAIVNAAPKSGGDPRRLLRIAFNSIIYGDGKLAACTHRSILGGVMEAIKLGITLGGPMQEGWLVPFNNRKKNAKGEWETVTEATLIVGYMGYRNIIDRGRAVVDMHPRAVHLADEFDYWFGDEPRIVHRPKGPAPLVQKDLRAAYCVARLRGGGKQMEVLEVPEIEAHKARSRAKDTGPWASPADYVPMALKTTVRKLAKYLPKSSELMARALDLDEKADAGIEQDFDLPEGAVIIDENEKPGASSSPSLGLLTEKLTGVPLVKPERAAVELGADDIFGKDNRG